MRYFEFSNYLNSDIIERMIKMAKIGSPLHVLWKECKRDLMEVVERLAEIGYDGIEFQSMFGNKPADIRRRLDSCGIKAVGDHVAFEELTKHLDKVIDEHKELGCEYITDRKSVV